MQNNKIKIKDGDKKIEKINYNNKQYGIYIFTSKSKVYPMVFDIEYYDKFHTTNISLASGYCVDTNNVDTNNNKSYIHNIIMNNTFDGNLYVDHISRNVMDNRKENLRLITQSDQNVNQNKRKRNTKISPDANDIPKCVWYSNDKKRFVLEFKHFPANVNIDKKPAELNFMTTGSKMKSYKVKLEIMKKYLRLLKSKYPSLIEKMYIEYSTDQEMINLINSYNDIISLSKYDLSECLIKYDTKNYIAADYNRLTQDEIDYIENYNYTGNDGTKRRNNKPPPDSGITESMIPKYCRYIKPENNRPEGFAIERHPKLTTKDWKTTRSSAYTLKEKYDQMMTKLQELNSLA